jgi:hypothetical protein
MKQRTLLFVLLLSLALMSASPLPMRKVRLTIINKSGLPMEYKLEGADDDFGFFYYLRVPEGDRISPTEKIFTIYEGEYTITAYYVELWDPVYGYSCGSSSKKLYVYRNLRLVFVECGQSSCPSGEPSMLKFSGKWRFLY